MTGGASGGGLLAPTAAAELGLGTDAGGGPEMDVGVDGGTDKAPGACDGRGRGGGALDGAIWLWACCNSPAPTS